MEFHLLNNAFNFDKAQHWLTNRKPVLKFYNDFIFIRDLQDVFFEKHSIEKMNQAPLVYQSDVMAFFMRRLEWDSQYFNQETFRMEGFLYDPELHPQSILDEIKKFVDGFQSLNKGCKIIAELPPEDVVLIQGLTAAGIKLIETRLIHFKHPVEGVEAVNYRKATVQDTSSLMNVAMKMRNPYDSLHADILFDNVAADAYLGTYVNACLNGFTDVVLVPDEPGIPSNAFIALNYRKHEWSEMPWKPAQIVLTAVDSDSNKGWYKKLVNAALSHVSDKGADCLFNTTQITNKIVIHTLESLGFKMAYSRLVFSN